MNKLTTATYHKTIPNLKSQEKIDVLKYFSQGVKKVGDLVVDSHDYKYLETNVGVIQGWVHANSKNTPHLSFRKEIIKKQAERKQYTVAIDSNLFLYHNVLNPEHYLRYSFNDVFPSSGIYCDTLIDPTRWQKISQTLQLNIKDYRTSGNHILLCLQRNGGWSMSGFDVVDWTNNAINKIREYSDRPIIIRPHPGDKASKNYLNPLDSSCRINFSKNVKLSTHSALVDDLRNCWAAVNHNSSPVVGAAIEGVPIFVTDPNNSQCKEIANTDFSKIENPQLLSRQQWVERLSMFHWNFKELQTGECWSHMRQFISNVV
jgi:hypothetical protein